MGIQSVPQMKVHPVPRKRSLTRQYDAVSAVAQAYSCRHKKLRRLPHVFDKVLELPFNSDADVLVDEIPRSFVFTATAGGIGGDVRTDAVEVFLRFTKIVVRRGGVVDVSGTELERDLWRFRLPASTQPDLTSTAYDGCLLVVTVPKDALAEQDGGDLRAANRVLIVQ